MVHITKAKSYNSTCKLKKTRTTETLSHHPHPHTAVHRTNPKSEMTDRT